MSEQEAYGMIDRVTDQRASATCGVWGAARALDFRARGALRMLRRRWPRPLNPRRSPPAFLQAPLAQALEEFARQTGLQLVYVSGVVRDQRSHAVSAGLAADAALARMLEGTGLTFEYLTPRSIRILAAVIAPPRESTRRRLPRARNCKR